MNNWVKRNLKNIIVAAFIIPILLVAFVSISHVTSFYGISNPWSWALYLSVGIEIAALSALAAVSVKMGRFIYIPFLIVTLIQMIGNVFFSFSYIDETSEIFKDWISMVGGIFENMGVETTDISAHKFILSFLTGGLLPIISLTFAHMLVKYSEQNSTEEDKVKEKVEEINVDEYEKLTSEYIEQKRKQDDELRYKPTEEEIKKFDNFLTQIGYQGPAKENTDDESRYKPTEKDLKKFEKVLSQYDSDNQNETYYKNNYQPNPNIISKKEESSNKFSVKKNDIAETAINKNTITTQQNTDSLILSDEKKIIEEPKIETQQQVIENVTQTDYTQETLSKEVVEKNIETKIIESDSEVEQQIEESKEETEQPVIEELKLDEQQITYTETTPQVFEAEESLIQEIYTEPEIEIQEIKPEPIDPNEKYKILKYFKKSD